MAESDRHRAEDAAFLDNMPAVLGPLAMIALDRIQAMLGPDYGGIDFGLSPRGEVVLFEANATMAANPPEEHEKWHYRAPVCKKIRCAAQEILCRRKHEALRMMLHKRSMQRCK